MRSITNTKLNEAARDYALEQLGRAQFENNRDAVISVASNFVDGAKFLLKEIEGNGEVINLIDDDFEYEH